MLFANGVVNNVGDGISRVKSTLHDGTACSKFQQMLVSQGVKTRTAEELCGKDADVWKFLTPAKHFDYLATQSMGEFRSDYW